MIRRVKMADIAEKLGISIVTVSNALSNRKGVSPLMRNKIIQTAQEMGYTYEAEPSVESREISERINQVGILVSERFIHKNAFYMSIHQSILLNASQRSFGSVLETIPLKFDHDNYIPRMVQDHTVSGIILLGQTDPGIVKKVSALEIPSIFLDSYLPEDHSDAVLSDNMNGACLLTNYLISQGHKDIMFVGSLDATSSIFDRYMGSLKAMIHSGITPRKQAILPDRDQNGHFIPIELPEKMPDAFFCNCDETACTLIRQLKERGLRVPEDVSVTGFDDYLYATLCEPQLTTFHVDIEKMGSTATRLLIDKIQRKETLHGKIVLQGSLVIRDSVRKAAS